MGECDFSRTSSTDEFYLSTERIVTGCIGTGESVAASTQKLTISERCVVFVVKKHLEENPSFFDATCEELQLTTSDFNTRLQEVWSGIFSDDKINWGRILTMLCFCRAVSAYSQRINLIPPSAVESIAPWASTFICTTLKDWINSEGGWESFPKIPNAKSQTSGATVTPQKQASGWVEQGFKGLAISLQLLDALRVR